MVGGQVLDMMSESRQCTEQEVIDIQSRKTGALIKAACQLGVLAGQGSIEQMNAAAGFAEHLGLAFQIKDDLLDYDGTESVGKPLGVDILEQKMTMPLLGALVNAGPQEDNRVRALVKDIVGHPEHRDEIVAFVKANGGMEYASERLDFYVNQAVEALAVLPESFEKTLLVKLARYTANREK